MGKMTIPVELDTAEWSALGQICNDYNHLFNCQVSILGYVNQLVKEHIEQWKEDMSNSTQICDAKGEEMIRA